MLAILRKPMCMFLWCRYTVLLVDIRSSRGRRETQFMYSVVDNRNVSVLACCPWIVSSRCPTKNFPAALMMRNLAGRAPPLPCRSIWREGLHVSGTSFFPSPGRAVVYAEAPLAGTLPTRQHIDRSSGSKTPLLELLDAQYDIQYSMDLSRTALGPHIDCRYLLSERRRS